MHTAIFMESGKRIYNEFLIMNGYPKGPVFLLYICVHAYTYMHAKEEKWFFKHIFSKKL